MGAHTQETYAWIPCETSSPSWNCERFISTLYFESVTRACIFISANLTAEWEGVFTPIAHFGVTPGCLASCILQQRHPTTLETYDQSEIYFSMIYLAIHLLKCSFPWSKPIKKEHETWKLFWRLGERLHVKSMFCHRFEKTKEMWRKWSWFTSNSAVRSIWMDYHQILICIWKSKSFLQSYIARPQ